MKVILAMPLDSPVPLARRICTDSIAPNCPKNAWMAISSDAGFRLRVNICRAVSDGGGGVSAEVGAGAACGTKGAAANEG
eukprot:CAMPEP_0182549946 /NCGR_PEP_ID=MMETSP1323-20130603/40907_1 /TAXON_ID=236787 /ORGANISM="Florenciella parvula, Strain RCC1693" /LENGTH=79 /DNA_ID=CAMNT_0024761443 /DNA_START=356 /DNA_END=591 /DNA_ORIENTATION=+